MLELCRKHTLAHNISILAKQYPAYLDFIPSTFVLPDDVLEAINDLEKHGNTYIVKPNDGSQVCLLLDA